MVKKTEVSERLKVIREVLNRIVADMASSGYSEGDIAEVYSVQKELETLVKKFKKV